MKKISKMMIVLFLLSFGCSAESENENDSGLNDMSNDVVVKDVGTNDTSAKDTGATQCDGLAQADCLSEASCEWYMMQEVSFENNVCVAGTQVEKCAPSSGTQAHEVFIDAQTDAAIISPVGGFGDSWGNWEGCETKENKGVCTCSSCLGNPPGGCDI